MSIDNAKQLFTTVTEDGKLVLSVEPYNVPEPAEHEVVVQMEAVPINPSDLGLLLSPAQMDTVRSEEVDGNPSLVADVDPAMMRLFAGRMGKKLPAGNEGAGTVVAAGSSDAAQALLGKVVTIVGGEMYRTHRVMPAMMCVPLPEGAPAKEGASLFVNPMTAQGFLNTMRAEGHEGLVHTAAASNLGQMLAKLCLKEGVPLVAIVRSAEQKKILTDIGLPNVPLRAGAWLVAVGARVVAGDPLLEVLAGDVLVDVPAPADGVLKRRCVAEDDELQVGRLLAVIVAESNDDGGIET